MLCALAALSACPPPTEESPCTALMTGDLVITEVMPDPEGTDTGNEWFEIFNALGSPVELKGLTLVYSSVDGSGSKTHVVRAGTAPARGYFTFGDVRSGANPAWIGYTYNSALGSFSNGSGQVAVRCGERELSKLAWTRATAAGRSYQLNGATEPSADRAALEANFCDTPVTQPAYSGGNRGTPGAPNATCATTAVEGTCVDGSGVARPIVRPAAGDLVITEVMGDPSAVADEVGEWIEVLARTAFDLNGLKLRTSGGSLNSHLITSPTCLTVQAGGYAVLARSAVGNGNLPTPRYVYSGLNLPNSAGTVSVTFADDTLLDAATTSAPISGRSWQLDPTKLTSADNDDPLNFCPAPAAWAGGDSGSPGVENAPCGASVDCSGRAAGDFIVTEVMADPDGTDTGNEWFELYNTRSAALDLTGLTLYRRAVDGSGEVQHVIPSGAVPATSYFVMGDVRSGTNPSWINYSYGAGLGALSNTSGVVGIRCGSLVLGEFTYTNAARAARSRMLDGAQQPPTVPFAIEANYCNTPPGTLYFGNNAGTPGSENPVCVPEATTGTCIEDGGMRPITSPNAGDLVISELMVHPVAPADTSLGEWFELYARAPVDLNDLTVYNNTSSSRLTSNECMHVEPGQYVLVARSADPFVNDTLPSPRFVYSGPSFTNTGNHRIGVRRGDAGVDEVQFSVPSANAGASWQLDPAVLDAVANDVWSNFCPSTGKWLPTGTNFGSPGTANHACIAAGSCFDVALDAGRALVPPPDGDLVITEWMTDPSPISHPNGEYFEFTARSTFDLNGVSFAIASNPDAGGTLRPIVASTTCVSTTAGAYYVVGRNPDAGANGGLPPFISTLPGNGLTATTVIRLLNPDAGVADSITAVGGGAGISQQVNPLFLTPADNDTNHCQTPAGTTYGTGNRGTPGLVNVACP